MCKNSLLYNYFKLVLLFKLIFKTNVLGNDTRLATQVVCYGMDGLMKLEGESWSMGCVDCICHGGRVMCNREVCPPAPCSHPLPPLPGECCPRCTTDMQPKVTSPQE